MTDIVFELDAGLGRITLNRPRALNALNLPMVRQLTQTLLAWQSDERVQAVAVRGSSKDGHFGTFCAGGDIRFFHQAALAGDPELEDFFTEEYRLNHLIHYYGKPYVALMDGVVMGGGMGISQGASLRVVTERTRMAMPETGIGLFPDVGGGYFLSRCPGHVGEYLGLTGQTLGAADALWAGLADVFIPSEHLPQAWEALAPGDAGPTVLRQQFASKKIAQPPILERDFERIEHCFSAETVAGILARLEQDGSAWAKETLALLHRRSPLMVHVVLEQIRRARSMTLAEDLRMERDLVRHCFHPRHLARSAAQSETIEGIRALAVDKDHAPRWSPPHLLDVRPQQVQPFFVSPWPAHAHPLRALQG